MKSSLKISWLGFFLFLTFCGNAQMFSENLQVGDSTQVHLLETQRGDILIGRVVKIEGTKLIFQLESGIQLEYDFKELETVQVKGADVLVSKPLRKKKIPKGRQVGRDSFSIQHMVYTYTAFPLKKGSSLYTNMDIFWNSIDWGVSDNITAGVASYFFTTLMFRGKMTFEVFENVHTGVGVNFINYFPEFDEFGVLTNFSAMISLGSPEGFANFTGGIFVPTLGTGVGRGYYGGLGFGGEKGKFTYRGELLLLSSQLSRRAYQPTLTPQLIFGYKKKHRRYEAGIIVLAWTDFPIIPYLGFKVHY